MTSVGADDSRFVGCIIDRRTSVVNGLGLFFPEELGLIRGLVLVLGLVVALLRVGEELGGRFAVGSFLIQLASPEVIGNADLKNDLGGDFFMPLLTPSSFRLHPPLGLLEGFCRIPSSIWSVSDEGVVGLESSVSNDDNESNLGFPWLASSNVGRLVNELPSDSSALFRALVE